MSKIPENLEKEIKPANFKGCVKCNDSGFIIIEQHGYKFNVPCDCYKNYQSNKRKEKCNIPEIYINADLDLDKSVSCFRFLPLGFGDVPVKKKDGTEHIVKSLKFQAPKKYDINKLGNQYVDIQSDYLKQDPRQKAVSLILSGTVGSGKTKFACAIANKFISKGLNVYYIKTKQYIDNVIKDQFKADAEKAEKLKQLRNFINGFNKNNKDNCHLLILDELGYEYQKEDSGFALAEIKDLLRNRAEKLYPTIITTNFKLNDLVLHYEEEMVSMFCESYMFLTVICSEDYRVKMSQKLDEDFDLDGLAKN